MVRIIRKLGALWVCGLRLFALGDRVFSKRAVAGRLVRGIICDFVGGLEKSARSGLGIQCVDGIRVMLGIYLV